MTKSKVALVIPVYGEAPFLSYTLESIERIEATSTEIFFSLDRASDVTRQKIEEFKKFNGNVTVLTSPNIGIVAALNLAISGADVDFIARLDADDEIHPERIDKQVQAFNSNSNLILVGSQVEFINENGESTGRSNYPIENTNIIKHLEILNCIAHPSVMFKKSVFLDLGGYRPFFTGAEDYDLWLRFARAGQIKNLKDEFTKYRKSDYQFTKSEESLQGVVESAVRVTAKLESLGIKVDIPDLIPKKVQVQDFTIKQMKILEQENMKYFQFEKNTQDMESLARILRSNHKPKIKIVMVKLFFFSIRNPIFVYRAALALGRIPLTRRNR